MTKRLKRWTKIVVIGLVVLGGLILLIKHWAAGSNNGTVHVGKPTPSADQTPTQPLGVNTLYFRTVLPPGFLIKSESTTPSSPIQLSFVANSKHQQFAVTIGTMPASGLDGVGDYHLRAADTSRYAPYRPAGMPEVATAFQATARPAEFAVFWPRGNEYAEIGLSSDGVASMAELFATFEQASHNWQWQ